MQHKTGLIDQIEETVIAVLLGLMTLITFAKISYYIFWTLISFSNNSCTCT